MSSERITSGADLSLTIALLTWNRSDDVVRCLEGLAPQADARGIPIVLLVNGSTDGTADRVRARFPHVEVHESPVNLGCPAGRNRLVDLCSSDWVAFIDDDGVTPPDLVDTMVRAVTAAPEQCGVVAGYMVDPAQSPRRWLPDATVGSFCAGVCAIRRDGFLAVGGFHEDGLRQGEEGELSIRLHDVGMTIERSSDLILLHPMSHSDAKRRELLRTGLRQALLTGVKLCPAWMVPGWTVWKLASFLRVAVALRAPRPYLAGVREAGRGLPSALRARRPASARAVMATRGRAPRLAHAARARLSPA